jgi:hypothetical protein
MTDIKSKLINGQINILNEMCSYIDDAIYYAVIVSSIDEYNTETEGIDRTLTFSRGTKNYKVSINWCGQITDVTRKIPAHMIVDIHNAICGQYLHGILEQATEANL